MQKRFRRLAWPMLALVAVMGLTAGVAMAHEGRPVGDYRFVVGWLEEPTYEGTKNAISVRVNKVAEDSSHYDSDGHHGKETGPTPATGRGESAGHDEGESQGATAGMGYGIGHHGPVEAASAKFVEVEATIDPVFGDNIHVMPSGFASTAESANLDNVEGKGPEHIYVDVVKLSRVYAPRFHLDDPDPGVREIEIGLSTNDQSVYTWGGESVAASTQMTILESGQGTGNLGSATAAADTPMSISFRAEPDPPGGADLFITDTTGIAFASRNASGGHVAGEGHAHVYVDSVKVSRVYGDAFQLGKMAEGMNEARVTLNANDHSEYTWEGEPVQETTTIHIAEGMGGGGYGTAEVKGEGASKDGDPAHDDHHGNSTSHAHAGEDRDHNSRLLPSRGAGQPLGSIAGQAQEEGVVPVEGLQGSLRVEVRHVASGASRTLELEAVAGDPGHYTAELIPTAPGIYEFRVFGEVEGTAIDETFVSAGGGGGFHDVRTSTELQFPVALPEVREIESGVRGAIETAQQAQDAALAAQQSNGLDVLVIVALVVGIVGTVLGTGGIFLGLRRRDS